MRLERQIIVSIVSFKCVSVAGMLAFSWFERGEHPP